RTLWDNCARLNTLYSARLKAAGRGGGPPPRTTLRPTPLLALVGGQENLVCGFRQSAKDTGRGRVPPAPPCAACSLRRAAPLLAELAGRRVAVVWRRLEVLRPVVRPELRHVRVGVDDGVL